MKPWMGDKFGSSVKLKEDRVSQQSAGTQLTTGRELRVKMIIFLYSHSNSRKL